MLLEMEDSCGEFIPSTEVMGNDVVKRDLQKKLTLLQEDNVRLRNEVAIMQQRMKDDGNEISRLLVEQGIYVTKFSRELGLAEKEARHLQVLERRAEELQIALFSSQVNIRMPSECHKTNEECDILNGRLKALQEELLQEQVENERLREEISTKNLDFNNLQVLFSTLIKEKECLEEDLPPAQTMGETEEELDVLKDQDRKLSSQLETLDQDQSERIQHLQGTIVDLQDHNKALEDQLMKFSEEHYALEMRLKEVQEENSRFQSELSDLRVVMQKQGQDEHNLEPEKTVLEGQITFSKKQIQILQQKFHCFKGNTKQFTMWLQGEPGQQNTFNEEIVELEPLLFHMKEEIVCSRNNTHGGVEEHQKHKVKLEGLQNKAKFDHIENNSLNLKMSNEEKVVKKLSGDNSHLYMENATLRNEISVSVYKIKNLEKECGELINRISKMAQMKEKESMMLHHTLKNLQQDNENLNCQLKNACKNCESADTQISAIQEQLLQLQYESISLEEQVASRDNRIKKLEDGFEKLLCENGSLQNEITQVNVQKTKLEEDVSSLWKLKAEFEVEIKSWSSKANALDADVCSLQDSNFRLATLSETQAMDMANLRLQIGDVQNEMNKLARNHQRDLEDPEITEKRIQQLQEKLSQLEHENEELKSLVSKKTNAIQELEDQMSSIEQENTVLKSEVRSLTKESMSQKLLIGELEESRKKTSEALIIDHDHIQRLVVTVLDLKRLNNTLELVKTALQVAYQEVHEQLEECQHMLEKLQEEPSGLADERNSLVSEASSKRSCISNLEREILSLKEKTSAKVDDMTLWAISSARLREEIGNWKDEKRMLQIELENGLSRMENDAQNLRQAIDKLKEENMNLKAEYQLVIKAYHSVINRIEDLQEKKMTLKENYRHLSEELGESEEMVKLNKRTADIQKEKHQEEGAVTGKHQEKILVLESEKTGLAKEMPHEVVRMDKPTKQFAPVYSEQNGRRDPLHAESEHAQMLELESLQKDLMGFNEKNKLMVDGKSAFNTIADQSPHDLFQLQGENYEIQQMEKMQFKVEELEKETEVLREENERLTLKILEGAEEKREAIRQLCFSLDHFQHENKQLRKLLSGIPYNYSQPTSS